MIIENRNEQNAPCNSKELNLYPLSCHLCAVQTPFYYVNACFLCFHGRGHLVSKFVEDPTTSRTSCSRSRSVGGICSCCCTSGVCTSKSVARVRCGSVVVVQSRGLNQIHRQSWQLPDEPSGDQRCDNEHNEEDEQRKVQNRVADDATSAQLGLLQRVNRWADLATTQLISTC